MAFPAFITTRLAWGDKWLPILSHGKEAFVNSAINLQTDIHFDLSDHLFDCLLRNQLLLL